MQTAAPWTPIFNWVIKTKSKIIFKTDETTKKTRGITLLPIALINPAHKLYANITIINKTIKEDYNYKLHQ